MLPISVFPSSPFPRTLKATDKSEAFNEKGAEWFPLHLITTSSLSLDERAVLDSIADNSSEVEDSGIRKLYPSVFKTVGGGQFLNLAFHCRTLQLALI